MHNKFIPIVSVVLIHILVLSFSLQASPGQASSFTDTQKERMGRLSPVDMLLVSASENDLALVEYAILDRQADINATDRNGWSALHYAVRKGHKDVILWLLQNGAHLRPTAQSQEITHLAAMNGDLEIMHLLMEHGAQANAIDPFCRNRTTLQVAASHHQLEFVRWLAEQGFDIEARSLDNNYTTQYGQTPLLGAAFSGDLAIVQLLANNYGANIFARGDNNQNAVHMATYSDSLELVLWLIEQGVEVNTVNLQGETPIHTAAYCRSHKVLQWLLNNTSLDLYARNARGLTAKEALLEDISQMRYPNERDKYEQVLQILVQAEQQHQQDMDLQTAYALLAEEAMAPVLEDNNDLWYQDLPSESFIQTLLNQRSILQL